MVAENQPLRKLRILVVSQYFWPENFRVNDLTEELVKSGHEVTVLTAKPNYPSGIFFPDFVKSPDLYNTYKGAKIIRVPIVARGKGGLQLILNYISYFISATLLGLIKLKGEKYDIIFVFQGSPVTVGIPAIVLRRVKKAPVVLWVLDLWPDTLLAVGAVKPGKIYNAVGALVSYIFNRCDLVLGQSQKFLTGIKKYCTDDSKIKYFPSWAEELFGQSDVQPATEVDQISAEFKIIFAGNIGDAQDFGSVLQAAELLKSHPQIKFIIVGDGRAFDWVKSEVKSRALEETFILLGRFPLDRIPSFYAAADALLVSLKSDPVFAMTIPGKTQSYLRAGKPILSMLDGEGSRVINDAVAGLTCNSGESEQLAENILRLSRMSNAERNILGANGKAYAEREFDRSTLLKKLELWFYELSR